MALDGYERAQLKWMIEHDVSLGDLTESLRDASRRQMTMVGCLQGLLPSQVDRMLYVDGDPVGEAMQDALAMVEGSDGSRMRSRSEWEVAERERVHVDPELVQEALTAGAITTSDGEAGLEAFVGDDFFYYLDTDHDKDAERITDTLQHMADAGDPEADRFIGGLAAAGYDVTGGTWNDPRREPEFVARRAKELEPLVRWALGNGLLRVSNETEVACGITCEVSPLVAGRRDEWFYFAGAEGDLFEGTGREYLEEVGVAGVSEMVSGVLADDGILDPGEAEMIVEGLEACRLALTDARHMGDVAPKTEGLPVEALQALGLDHDGEGQDSPDDHDGGGNPNALDAR